ncbi:spore coat protein [Neobacillus niacini]|uniref:spore coat protein n=1 Tax=Neobacillus niacini TaxID=86668 RepID=UPI0039833A45
MSDSNQNPLFTGKIIDLLVSDILRKNGINIEKGKTNLSPEQKQLIKDLVNDLSQQVDAFVSKENPTKNADDSK